MLRSGQQGSHRPRFGATNPGTLKDAFELYRLNESGRFPVGFREIYKKFLVEQSCCFLVLETDQGFIASGGSFIWGGVIHRLPWYTDLCTRTIKVAVSDDAPLGPTSKGG